MPLGVPERPKNAKPQKPLGVTQDPSATPANLMGKQKPKGNSVPEYQGPLPGANTPSLPPGSPTAGPQLPPNNNGPIFPQDPVQPISYNGGYYNPTEAPYGFDMSAPGVAEQFWNNNQNLWLQSPQMDWVDSMLPEFQDPWQGEQTVGGMLGSVAQPGAGQQFWNGVGGSFNSMGRGIGSGYTGPNRAAEAYDMTKGMLPGSLQPQFDAYYDRMKDKVMSDVNSQSAARGAYGSNTALNNSIGAGLDVEAQRAKAATDFMLADSANQMGWQGLLGNQARGADLTGLGIFGSKLQGANYDLNKLGTFGDLAFKSEGMELDKNKTLADMAFGLDDQKLERLGAGISTAFNSQQAHRGQLNDAFDAANIVQDQREGRVNNLYNQVSDFSNDINNFLMQNYDAILGGDMQAFEQQMQAMIAQEADQRGWDEQTRERVWRDFSESFKFLMNAKEANKLSG